MKMFKSYQLTRACRAPKKVENCVIVKDKPLPFEGDGLKKKHILQIFTFGTLALFLQLS